MKIDKKMFILARARNIGASLAEEEFDRLSKLVSDKKKDKVKIYLDEYGNEVHVKGPIVDRIHKSESLAERIARYDRLAAAVNASRQSMALAFGDMFTDIDEDPNDDKLLDDAEVINEFGEAVKPSVTEPVTAAPSPAEPATKESVAAADTIVDANGGDNAAGDSPHGQVKD